MADVCGVSGIGRRRHLRALQLLQPGCDRRQGARVHPVDERHSGLQHRLEQLRAERRRGVAAERAERLPADAARRSGAGDAARRLLGRLRAPGHGRVHRHVRRQPRQHAAASPATRATGTRPARRDLAGSPAARRRPAVPRAVPGDAESTRSRVRPNRADDLNIFASGHPDRVRAAPGPSASSARSRETWRSTSATSAPAAWISGPTINYNEREPDRERVPQRVPAGDGATCRRTTPRAASRAARSPTSGRAPARRRCRSTSRISTARATSNNPGRVHRRPDLDELDVRGRLVATNPQPVERRPAISTATPRAAPTRSRAGTAGELLRRQPATSTT